MLWDWVTAWPRRQRRVEASGSRERSNRGERRGIGIHGACAIAFAFALAIVGYSPFASAQAEVFDLDRAQISGAPGDGFMVHRPYMAEKTRFYGNLALGYAHNPLRRDAVTDDLATQLNIPNPVQGQFVLYPSVGVEILGRIGFNMHLPFIPLQFMNAVGEFNLTPYYVALGDFRFDARGMLWESNDRRTRFGVEGFFTAGTGLNEAFASDRSASAQLSGSFEHHFDGFFIAAQLGPHFRPRSDITQGEGDLVLGNELRWALGAFIPLRDDAVRLGVEVWGGTGIEEIDNQMTFLSRRNTYLEWLAQARFLVGKKKRLYTNFGAGTRMSAGYGAADFRVLASIGYFFRLTDKEPAAPPEQLTIQSRPEHYEVDTDGDGYPDGIDNCPNDKEDGEKPHQTDGCPNEPDQDNDGIPDRLDKCPNDPEDLDKIEDKDGCPEDDADNDKVLDKVDKCPLEPGPPNADKSKNGCPTLTKVTDDGSISLLKNIEFDLGRSTIKPVSYPILDEVVTLLEARPEVRLAIHGHTDSQGNRANNMKLSKDRAAAVRRYLINKGISADRLESEGFGPDRPIDTNATAAGRAKNRRVEFIVLEEDSGTTDW